MGTATLFPQKIKKKLKKQRVEHWAVETQSQRP